MNVGLPGTGIAGIFYLLAALWMPCHAIVRAARGGHRSVRWPAVLRQTGLAFGIILALVATAWLLDLAFAAPVATGPDAADEAGRPTAHNLGTLPTVLSFATLAATLLGVEVLRLIAGRKRRREQTA